MLAGSKLKPSRPRLEALHDAWRNLIGPGPTLNSAERVRIIGAARAGWAGAAEPGAGILDEIAHWLAVDAGGLTAGVVDDLERRGLDRFRYLETVGVVARLANVDFYIRGLGGVLPPIPQPIDSAPTGEVVSEAGLTDGWVPATGPLVAPFTLDALPGEGEALRAIHESMYMPRAEMANAAYHDVLSRIQIEYIAARTSFLNECFY